MSVIPARRIFARLGGFVLGCSAIRLRSCTACHPRYRLSRPSLDRAISASNLGGWPRTYVFALAIVRVWLTLATSSEPNDPNAAALATASPDGLPNVRMVLVKGIDAEGFSFYTNEESQKGQEMRANPRAALCLHWKSLRRQIRTRGSVINLPDAVTDHYFHSRGRRSQIGAAVSRQSRPLPSREHLE